MTTTTAATERAPLKPRLPQPRAAPLHLHLPASLRRRGPRDVSYPRVSIARDGLVYPLSHRYHLRPQAAVDAIRRRGTPMRAEMRSGGPPSRLPTPSRYKQR
ncbi:hypothetical protein K523DRAFT_359281 [Schizophyllum commune Tattone D]|nr:hypothetical protein K523DRAFT_359281 [Schizophyllum commune Tattone D]